MIHLDCDHLGRLVLLIEDAKGEPQYYSLNVKPYAVLLCRQDTRDLYRLRRTADGWTCSCKAFLHRRSRTDCKHTRCLQLLWGAVQLLQGMEHHERERSTASD